MTVLQAIVDAAVRATAAERGWLVAAGPTVAAAQPATSATPRADGPAAMAMATGLPAARHLGPADSAAYGAAGWDGIPPNVLAIPCGSLGALELAGKRGGFTVDDIEVVTLLADVAEAALAGAAAASVPEPAFLAAGLSRLSVQDPARYAQVAGIVAALL